MFRIKKLDIFIAKQFGMLFMGTFFICQFVLMMQFLWRYVDELIGKGLSVEVLAQFFWYMALMLVPQALPLAILLSSLITFGNMGETSELTAIKAAGVSLLQSFRALIFISVMICLGSFYFQNKVGPDANMKLAQLLISMKQTSPELEIPEGIFYDGIPNSNLYVQKKDLKTGKLYGIMVYRMTGSYEDQAIILADSGMLQSTAEKKHLLLSLWSGEWFENMQTQALGNSAAVPYRRESFASKRIVLDYDGGFNMTDANGLANNASGKSISKIAHDIDSLNANYDSIGHMYYADQQRGAFWIPSINKHDSIKAVKAAYAKTFNIDSVYNKLSDDKKLSAVNRTLQKVQSQVSDLNFKALITKDGDGLIRRHYIEYIKKFTLALSCLLFFFIGAPLGAIIRKGGLGIPVIISVLVFIIYYILENTGTKMARDGNWNLWFGTLLSTAVLTPAAVFFTYKANNDSVVFNIDVYTELLRKMLGLRIKRHILGKEVIIDEPHYEDDMTILRQISKNVTAYSQKHKLIRMPNPIKVFFKYKPDHAIEQIGEQLEKVINDLSNTRNSYIIAQLNQYPVISTKAHTRPFERKWMNIIAGIVLPVGAFLYLRMWRFRLRLLRDLRIIRITNQNIVAQIRQNQINITTHI